MKWQVVTKYGYSIIGRPPSRGAWIEIKAPSIYTVAPIVAPLAGGVD